MEAHDVRKKYQPVLPFVGTGMPFLPPAGEGRIEKKRPLEVGTDGYGKVPPERLELTGTTSVSKRAAQETALQSLKSMVATVEAGQTRKPRALAADTGFQMSAQRLVQTVADYALEHPSDAPEVKAMKALPPKEVVELQRRALNALINLGRAGAVPGAVHRTALEARNIDQSMGSRFDIDDNLFFMPTKIIGFQAKEDGTLGQVEYSSEEWAQERGKLTYVSEEEMAQLKAEGKLEPGTVYAVTSPTINGSFQQFGDIVDPGRFARDVAAAVHNSMLTGEIGPSFPAIIEMLNEPRAAAETSLKTARAHRSQTVVDAFSIFQKMGLIKYLPKPENVLCCASEEAQAKHGLPSHKTTEVKIADLELDFERTSAKPFGASAMEVITPDGKGKAPMHLEGFSDDDPKTMAKTTEWLTEQVGSGRWPNTKFFLFDAKKDGLRPMVITKDGPRALKPGEEQEYKEMLKQRKARATQIENEMRAVSGHRSTGRRRAMI